MRPALIVWCVAIALVASTSFAGKTSEFNFSFVEKTESGQTRVMPDALYSAERGYGFEPGAAPHGEEGPFRFSTRLPEGNYDVVVTFGGTSAETDTTVRAESRRLMIESVPTEPDKIETRTFTVNVRTPRLPSGGEVKLKERERQTFTWDDKLTLEFTGSRPSVREIRIVPASPKTITVFLAGDSTVTDQAAEPWAAWGQMLPRFFKAGVVIANHAESGESLRSFRGARRLDKILSEIKAGDYLFIQFGHNDAKAGSTHVEPFTTYKQELAQYVAAARAKGATPVLVTSMHRRTFGPDGRITNSHGDYPEAVRQLAREQKVGLIDLHAMSAQLYEALGVKGSLRAFVHYPAKTYPAQEKPLKDDTHFNAYGAYQLARCVVRGLRATDLPLGQYLLEDTSEFDPSKPEDPARWALPPSLIVGQSAPVTPAGS